jgi:hypothetical protein
MFNTKIAIRTLFFALLAAGLSTTGCKDDGETEQENITRVVLHLSSADGFDQEFTWEDLDGDGGNAPTIPTLVLPKDKVLSCRIHVYDDTTTPVTDLTEEIEEERDEHLFTFVTSGNGLVISNLSADSKGNPFGLESTWTTGGASTGTVRVTLYHEPEDKNNASAPGGDTDYTATFPFTIN